MNNTKLYIIIAVSIAINLFFIGMYAGRYVNKHRPPMPIDGGHSMMMCPMCNSSGGMPMKHHNGEMMQGMGGHHKGEMMPDMEMGMMHKGHKMSGDTFSERHNRKGMRRVFCGNVSEDVLKLEKEMLEKNKDAFKANFKAEMELKEALNAEFKKENLDMNAIKDLFTKQTERFISIQKQAQDSLLEMITKLPYEKRAEAICSKNKDDLKPMPKKMNKQDFEKHHGRNEGKLHHR